MEPMAEGTRRTTASPACHARRMPTASTGARYVFEPNVSFNTALNAYVTTFVSSDGFYYTTSQDMVNWTTPGPWTVS